MSFDPPESFNLADYLLDARVREGRGDRTALVCGERRSTYREVQALAHRFGHVLRRLGVEPEQRVIVALPDGPEFVGALFGTLKIGAVVVMVNPQLKADDVAYFFEYTRARVAVVAGETLEAFAAAARDARWLKRLLVVGEPAAGHASYEKEAASAPDTLDNVAHAPRRRGDLALLRGYDGTAEGGGADAPLVREHDGALREGHSRLRGDGRHALRAQALLRLRHRLEPLLSVLGGRDVRALPRAPDARGPLREDPAPPSDRPHQRPHGREPDGLAPRGGAAGPVVPPLRHVGGGGPAPRAVPALEGDVRGGASRRAGNRRDVAHLPHEPRGRREAGDARQARRRFRREGGGRRRSRAAGGGDGPPLGEGPLPRHRLLAADGQDGGGLPRRVVRDRRPRRARRRRLLHALRPRRRDAQGLGAVGRAPGGRGLPAAARRRSRSARWSGWRMRTAS